ncbi:uncharacterized protein LOC111205465 [Brassica napus]|uniref:uncharacterized protein LOC111205465 n=1 Tax=Brassica napus TaxID=3708 RepID=UPI0020799D2E|nr:uncharacterized protein LOC111205465 [Brassica napus]
MESLLHAEAQNSLAQEIDRSCLQVTPKNGKDGPSYSFSKPLIISMDTYSSRVIAHKAPFDSKAAAKDKAIDQCRAFVILLGYDAKEKALQLNGSDMGGWNALVKFAPEEEDEEYQVESEYKDFVINELLNDKRFRFGIAVLGYDPSLPEDEVKSILTEHFSSCGVITHVYVCTLDECTNIYFSKKEGEASAMDLNGSKVGGFKITTMLLATAISNPRLAPGDEPTVGYSIPAPFLEFAREINKKLDDYMTEWRVKARREQKFMAS